jgi:hypothetical protein
MVKMAETRKAEQPGARTPERAQVIIELFRAIHPERGG